MTDPRHPSIGPSGLTRLARVMERWKCQHGATEVCLPWVVPEAYVEATRPAWAPPQPRTPHGWWVASGEQSFIWLAEENRLPKSRCFIGWTPCVREENFDAHHHYTFLKAEVFAWAEPGEDESLQVRRLLAQARAVLTPEAPEAPTAVPLEDGSWDLELAGMEVGSYGVRSLPQSGRRYLYGTAVAEPRFSQALELLAAGGSCAR